MARFYEHSTHRTRDHAKAELHHAIGAHDLIREQAPRIVNRGGRYSVVVRYWF